MSSHEFSEWIAFASNEPLGNARSDLQAAIVASTIANVNRGKKGKTFKPIDFIAKFWPEFKNWQTQLSQVEMLNELFGGKDARKK